MQKDAREVLFYTFKKNLKWRKQQIFSLLIPLMTSDLYEILHLVEIYKKWVTPLLQKLLAKNTKRSTFPNKLISISPLSRYRIYIFLVLFERACRV